jgi:hypothetical protein
MGVSYTTQNRCQDHLPWMDSWFRDGIVHGNNEDRVTVCPSVLQGIAGYSELTYQDLTKSDRPHRPCMLPNLPSKLCQQHR